MFRIVVVAIILSTTYGGRCVSVMVSLFGLSIDVIQSSQCWMDETNRIISQPINGDLISNLFEVIIAASDYNTQSRMLKYAFFFVL